MKVFSPVKDTAQSSRAEILNELRNISERQGVGLRKDSFLSLTNDREDQFFLKSVQNFVLWGKVYFEIFTPEKAEQLKKEQAEMKHKFLQPIKLQVFFSEGGIDTARAEDYPEADYYRYSILQSAVEKAIMVERVSFEKKAMTVLPPLPSLGESTKRQDYRFSKQSQLTRNELAELIDLSLDLKRS